MQVNVEPKCDYPLPNVRSQPPARQYSHHHFSDKEVVSDLLLVSDSVFIHYQEVYYGHLKSSLRLNH